MERSFLGAFGDREEAVNRRSPRSTVLLLA